MHSAIATVVAHLAAKHPKAEPGFDAAIRDCAERGFSVVQIIAAFQTFYGVSGSEAKQLVTSHPVWGDVRERWQQFHTDLEKALEGDKQQ